MPFALAKDGTRLHYITQGEGESVILLSGQSYDHSIWVAVADRLSESFRVTLFDYRGTGQSDKPSDQNAYSTSIFAGDIASVMDEIGAKKAAICGFSFGGRVAQRFAVDYVERTSSLVLVSTTPGNQHGIRRQPEVDALFLNVASSPEESIRRLAAHFYTKTYLEAHPDTPRTLLAATEKTTPEARTGHFLASEGHSMWDELLSIAAPTFVLHGAKDEVNPASNAILLRDHIPGAHALIVPHGRHMCLWESIDFCIPAVERHLQASFRRSRQ